MSLLQADRSILETALLGVLAPAGTAAAVLLVASRPWRDRTSGAPPARWGAGLAIGLSFAVAYVVTQGWPPLPPDLGVKQWLFYGGLFGGFYGVYEGLAERRSLLTRAVLAVAAPVLLLQFMREHHWTLSESILWTGGLAAVLFLSWLALEALSRRRPGAPVPLGWALSTGLGAGALHLSGSFHLAQLAGALCTALAACSLLGYLRPGIRLAPDGIAPLALLHFGLVWAGRFASKLSFAGFALLSIAPLLAWSGELLPASRRRWRVWTTVLGPSLAALVALLLEYAAAPESPYG